MSVHANVNSRNGPVDLGTILQFNGNRLVTEFHQKSSKLHDDEVLKNWLLQTVSTRSNKQNRMRYASKRAWILMPLGGNFSTFYS